MYEHFTSFGQQEERTFVVYEQKSQQDGSAALKISLVVSAIVLAAALIIALGFGGGKGGIPGFEDTAAETAQ
jgi:hypothetical protein